MNLNYTMIHRRVRNAFDYLSDIGGLQATLTAAISIFLSAFRFNLFDNFMISQLFSGDPPDAKGKEQPRTIITQPGMLTNFMNWLVVKLPSKCVCCTRSKHTLALERARTKYNKEVNILQIVKTMRQLKLSLAELMPKDKLKELKNRSQYLQIAEPATPPKNATDDIQEAAAEQRTNQVLPIESTS